MMQIRYPQITGATPEERQKEKESDIRYLAGTPNWALNRQQ